MSDIGSSYPVPIGAAKETITTKLLWVAVKKQEVISKINHLKQAIEDIQKGKILDYERQILLAQQDLDSLIEQEGLIKSSVEAEQI